ncbi:hypothetical protein [Paenibacillus cymbidii]|uniref:hypothetical protein n=1 Tax=Paenibacillus cymbidii TaxID=1639034 RepID=UPI00108024DA|nr:hypothetical protein [Paenibacillus cymbidii]
MVRGIRSALAALALLIWLAPAQAFAYSYGDANTEDVAETFKTIAAALGGGQSDWKTATEAHKVRRSEIQSHFGDAVAATLDKNIEAADNALLIANYKAVLVMNLDRRFAYALQDVGDYAGAKLLLAKAKATYDTLAPYMSAGKDEIDRSFDEALDALGNPGLFGVGKKKADPELFKTKVTFIYDKVKPLFPYQAYAAPAPEPAKPAAASVAPAAATPEAKPAAATAEPEKPQAAESPAQASPSPSASASASPTASASASPTAASSTTPAASSAAQSSASAEAPKPTPAASSAAAPAASGQALQQGEHAPMERTNKVNPLVTVFVIAGVVLAGGGALWYSRKKGFF